MYQEAIGRKKISLYQLGYIKMVVDISTGCDRITPIVLSMNETMLQGLPLGLSDFRSLRANDEIYVDKTALIYDMAEPSQRKKLFLVRPRRFGKSLLISTC